MTDSVCVSGRHDAPMGRGWDASHSGKAGRRWVAVAREQMKENRREG